jgi:ribosome-binding factor A
MEFDRHDRARALFSELIARFIREEANVTPLITVTNVEVSPNYHNVKVFITTIPEGGERDALIFLKRKGGELREYVKKRGRLKFIPYFDFEIDYGERHRQHIDALARKIKEEEDT